MNPRPSGSNARRRVKRTVQFIVLLFALNYLVLPQLARLGPAIQQLTSIRSSLLVLGIGPRSSAPSSPTASSPARRCRRAGPAATDGAHPVRRPGPSRNVVPGGSAAGSALGYRLLTLSGVRGADAGFALATAGPRFGRAAERHPLDGPADLASRCGASARSTSPRRSSASFLIGVFFGIVLSLVQGREQVGAGREGVARKLRLDPERAAEVVERLADRLRDLLDDKVLLRRVAIWGTLNWLLDAASLWVFLYAFGGTLSLDGLLVSFGLANLFAAIPITPGGLGIVEGIYIPTLVAFGVPPSVAALGVPIYRLAQYWLPTLLGGVSYLTLRVGPVSPSDARAGSSACATWPSRPSSIPRARSTGPSATATARSERRAHADARSSAQSPAATAHRRAVAVPAPPPAPLPRPPSASRARGLEPCGSP